jgi:hypothetical protein
VISLSGLAAEWQVSPGNGYRYFGEPPPGPRDDLPDRFIGRSPASQVLLCFKVFHLESKISYLVVTKPVRFTVVSAGDYLSVKYPGLLFKVGNDFRRELI